MIAGPLSARVKVSDLKVSAVSIVERRAAGQLRATVRRARGTPNRNRVLRAAIAGAYSPKPTDPQTNGKLRAALAVQFEKNMTCHQGLAWTKVQAWLDARLRRWASNCCSRRNTSRAEAGRFRCKRSSWLAAPADFRKQGGALWDGRSFGRVFIGCNDVDSYHVGCGFRAS